MGADLAVIQLMIKFDKGIRFLLCVIDIFCKYAWVIPLKHVNVKSRTYTDFNKENNKEGPKFKTNDSVGIL